MKTIILIFAAALSGFAATHIQSILRTNDGTTPWAAGSKIFVYGPSGSITVDATTQTVTVGAAGAVDFYLTGCPSCTYRAQYQRRVGTVVIENFQRTWIVPDTATVLTIDQLFGGGSAPYYQISPNQLNPAGYAPGQAPTWDGSSFAPTSTPSTASKDQPNGYVGLDALGNARVGTMALSPTKGIAAPLPFARFFSGDMSTKKILLYGNSTVALADAFKTQLASHAVLGDALEGMTVTPEVDNTSVSSPNNNQNGTIHSLGNIINYGNNGCLLSDLLTPPGTCTPFYPISGTTSLCSSGADMLVMRGPLINDVRQGAMTLAQTKTLLKTALDTITACLPNTDILLLSENSMGSTDVNSHGYVVPNSSAQAYSTILRDAVIAFQGAYPQVYVVDTQSLLYGAASVASSPLMFDQLHPNTAGQVAEADLVAQILGSFRQNRAVGAQPQTDALSDFGTSWKRWRNGNFSANVNASGGLYAYFGSYFGNWQRGGIFLDSNGVHINSTNSGSSSLPIRLGFAGTDMWTWNTNGTYSPNSDNSYDIGGNGNRVRIFRTGAYLQADSVYTDASNFKSTLFGASGAGGFLNSVSAGTFLATPDPIYIQFNGAGKWVWYANGIFSNGSSLALDGTSGNVKAVSYTVGSTAGVTKTCSTAITAMTVVGGIVTSLTCP